VIAVFDIDGTLTDTMDVDVECYVAAVRETLDIEIDVSVEWTSFDEVTDTAVLETICELDGRPAPDAALQRRTSRRMAELLEEALTATPERFRPIPGAPDVFDLLRAAGWQVAMATGAWRPSARVKLRGAGIPVEGVPLATSTEHRARRDIIRRAVSEVGTGDEAVVYIGDGVWDGRAAGSLDYPFIGIGMEQRLETLRCAGAAAVLPDLSNAERLLTELADVVEGG